jgi:8-oxo-dGTP diphosphatase
MKIIQVTCAIITFGNKTLVVQRSEKMKHPMKWEFPGGKIEKGETEENCLIREIKEELHIEIEILKRLTPSIHEYPNLTIELIPFIANHLSGEITLTEHQEYKLLLKNELNELDWAEADIPILNEYLKL